MRFAVLFGAVGLAVLGACGGSNGSQNGGFREHEVSAGGFAISVPSSWKTLDDLDDDAVESFSRENPEFAPFMEAARANDAVDFIALDPEVTDEFATNLNVIVAPVPTSLTFERWVDGNVRTIDTIESAQVTSKTPTKLPTGRAVRLVWSYALNQPGGARRVAVDQYYVRRDGEGFVLTYTTLPAQAAAYRPTFAQSARSFEFR